MHTTHRHTDIHGVYTGLHVCRQTLMAQMSGERAKGSLHAAQTFRHSLPRHQDKCLSVTLWNRKCSFL